jgi:hypothetical protein
MNAVNIYHQTNAERKLHVELLVIGMEMLAALQHLYVLHLLHLLIVEITIVFGMEVVQF